MFVAWPIFGPTDKQLLNITIMVSNFYDEKIMDEKSSFRIDDKMVIAGALASFQAWRVSNLSSGLSCNHVEILYNIYLGEGITRQELSKCVPDLSATTLKRVVKELVDEDWEADTHPYTGISSGLVKEIPDEDDAKIQHLFLSDMGKQTINDVIVKMRSILDCLN